MVLEALNGGAPEDRLSYLAKTADGKTLKSTTVYIRDEDKEPIGIFSINYDITLMLAMEGTLRITKSGGKVCKYFGISKYTLYSYMEEARGGKE